MNRWIHTNNMEYYYRESDGKILGAAWHYHMNSAVWTSKIYTEDFPFTNESEKFLGHFIDSNFAKQSVEKYWLLQLNTLEFKHESGD